MKEDSPHIPKYKEKITEPQELKTELEEEITKQPPLEEAVQDEGEEAKIEFKKEIEEDDIEKAQEIFKELVEKKIKEQQEEKKCQKCGNTNVIPCLKIGKVVYMCEKCCSFLDEEKENENI